MLRNSFAPPCGFDLSTTTIRLPSKLAEISYWGYRLVVHPGGDCFVHETYYDVREGILGIAREPARPCGDTASEVQEELVLMEKGLNEPSLRYLDYASEDLPDGTAGDGADSVAPTF